MQCLGKRPLQKTWDLHRSRRDLRPRLLQRPDLRLSSPVVAVDYRTRMPHPLFPWSVPSRDVAYNPFREPPPHHMFSQPLLGITSDLADEDHLLDLLESLSQVNAIFEGGTADRVAPHPESKRLAETILAEFVGHLVHESPAPREECDRTGSEGRCGHDSELYSLCRND